jgi:putative chitobiose transport system permease protein
MLGPFLYLALGSVVRGNLLTLFAGHSAWQLLDPSLYTLDNYLGEAGVWHTFRSMRLFENTFVLCVLGVCSELVIASLAAYPLARMEFAGRGGVLAVLFSTLMLPGQATMLVNFDTIRYLGLYDTYAAVLLPGLVSVFGIFLVRQAYITIPRELDEAARIDGADDFIIWWRIMLPLSRPALGTLAIFSFVGHWNSFLWPLVVLKSEQRYPLAVGLQFLAEVFDKTFGKIAAGAVLATVPIVVVFLLMQRQFIRGITAGAGK